MISNNIDKKTNIIITNIIPFAVCFIIMLFHLVPLQDMTGFGGDANDMWKSIESWYSSSRYGSYVLYKGIVAVYPWVWLYKMGMWLANEWIFIKIAYAVFFSLLTTYFIPEICILIGIKRITGVTRIVIGVLLFYLWLPTNALDHFMVDLPTALYFSIAVCFFLKIKENRNTSLIIYIIFGFFWGMSFSSTGQYSIAAIIIFGFFIKKIFMKHGNGVKDYGGVFLFLLSSFFIIFCDRLFINQVVNPLIENGSWILSRKQAREVSVFVSSPYYKRFSSNDIELNRIVEVYRDYFDVSKEQILDMINGWAVSLSLKEFIKIFLLYPIDLCTSYFTKLIIALSPSDKLVFVPLFLFYTCLFGGLLFYRETLVTLKDCLEDRFCILFVMLSTVVAPLVTTVEMRYVILLQGFIVGIGVPYISTKIFQKDENVNKMSVSVFFEYVLFVAIMISFYAVLNEFSYDFSLFSLYKSS